MFYPFPQPSPLPRCVHFPIDSPIFPMLFHGQIQPNFTISRSKNSIQARNTEPAKGQDFPTIPSPYWTAHGHMDPYGSDICVESIAQTRVFCDLNLKYGINWWLLLGEKNIVFFENANGSMACRHGSIAGCSKSFKIHPANPFPPFSYGYGSIPIDTFLVGWTSIYQLFWGSLGTFLTHPHISNFQHMIYMASWGKQKTHRWRSPWAPDIPRSAVSTSWQADTSTNNKNRR